MSVKPVVSFKESPFNSFQIGNQQATTTNVLSSPQPQVPAISTPAVQTPAPAVQTPAPAVQTQVTPAQAQVAQATVQPDKTDITKILAIGATTLSVATLGYMIYSGKKPVKADLSSAKDEFAGMVKKAVDGLDQKFTKQIQEVQETLTKKAATEVAEEGAKAGSKAALRILEAFGLVLGGEKVVEIIKGMPNKNDDEMGADKKQIEELVQTKFQDKKTELVNEVKAEMPQTYAIPKRISAEGATKIREAARVGLHGERPWDIENPNPWMVTAEVKGIVSSGGLGVVAAQMPEAFNDTYIKDLNKNMTTVMPMYIRDNDEKGRCKLTKIGDNEYIYKADGSEIKVKKQYEGSLKIYDPGIKGEEDQKYEVYTGEHQGTKYIFIKADKYFNLDDGVAKITPYGKNKFGTTEGPRFAAFSKMAVDVMKNAKEGTAGSIEPPKVVVANDWHAGAMAPVMRYTIPAMASDTTLPDDKKLNAETAEYFDKTPIMSIVHNGTEQGTNNQSEDEADALMRMVLGEYNDEICGLIDQTGANKTFPMSTGIGTYNPAVCAANLVDGMIAVSKNYARELSVSDKFTKGVKDAFIERINHGTLSGIVNGYDKKLAEPNEKYVKDANEKLKLEGEDRQFKVYDANSYNVKLENKEKLSYLLQDIINEAKDNKDNKANAGSKIELVDPKNCEVPTGKDFANTPVICSVGRMVKQKGFDYFIESIKQYAEGCGENDAKPVFIILGSANNDAETQKEAKILRDVKDALLKSNSPKQQEIGKRLIILLGYNDQLRDAIYYGSDFAALTSKWEPCGLTQMEAMAKGTIPVTTATGGFVDTVINGETGYNGTRFYEYLEQDEKDQGKSESVLLYNKGKEPGPVQPRNNVDAFTFTLDRAVKDFTGNKERIEKIFKNDMNQDFSWGKEGGAINEYLDVFQHGVKNKGGKKENK